ncbi:hypothetical protein F5Y09DRAFT_133667 [Xylaria sp. FL1042]|nr:hypothetical protein F5Y09DRAFT_133667 [Xylaria sp. FL1042]
MQYERETHDAWQAVESARATLELAQRAEGCPRDLSHDDSASTINSHSARLRLDTALDFVKRRNWCLTEFTTASRDHWKAKNDMELYGIRIEWISRQIPVIEREINKSRVTDICQDAIQRTNRIYGRDSTDTLNRPSLKRRRRSTSRLSSWSSYSSEPDHPVVKSKRGNKSIAYHRPPTKRFRAGCRNVASLNEDNTTKDASQPSTFTPVLRRSARIKAYQQR